MVSGAIGRFEAPPTNLKHGIFLKKSRDMIFEQRGGSTSGASASKKGPTRRSSLGRSEDVQPQHHLQCSKHLLCRFRWLAGIQWSKAHLLRRSNRRLACERNVLDHQAHYPKDKTHRITLALDEELKGAKRNTASWSTNDGRVEVFSRETLSVTIRHNRNASVTRQKLPQSG